VPLRIRVCRADEIAPGETRAFDVEGLAVPVLVANVEGRLLAASSMCPHEEVSLLGGLRTGTRIVCPGHAYEFDLATGRCAHDPALRLPCYRVSVVDGDLYIEPAY
jgi:nitrite reductase/ring-hydroxylating ferredoxin subunit